MRFLLFVYLALLPSFLRVGHIRYALQCVGVDFVKRLRGNRVEIDEHLVGGQLPGDCCGRRLLEHGQNARQLVIADLENVVRQLQFLVDARCPQRIFEVVRQLPNRPIRVLEGSGKLVC